MVFLILLLCFCTLEYASVIVVKLTMKSWGMRGEKGKTERSGRPALSETVRLLTLSSGLAGRHLLRDTHEFIPVSAVPLSPLSVLS